MRALYLFTILLCFSSSFAQNNRQSAFVLNYNYQIPQGFFVNHFGDNSAIGASFFIEKENNFFFGIDGRYLFGRNVNEENMLFDNISTEAGALIASDGYYANVNLMQSGFDTHVFIGYAFHFNKKDLSGIYISTGLGYLQQKIIIDTKNENIPQLNEEYKKGYDKSHSGISSKVSLDYKYYRKKGHLQISTGINYTLANVKYNNPYLFNEMTYTKLYGQNWGGLFGIQIGLIIPIQKINQEEFHYY